MHEDLWKTLAYINEWVRFSEGKAVGLLAAQGVLISVIGQNGLDYEGSHVSWALCLGSVALILNIISMFYAFMCLNPRLKLRGGVSPLFFGSIAQSFKNSADYQRHFMEKMTDSESVSKELCGQIFVNSQIADRKFRNVAYSIRIFVVSILFWACFTFMKVVERS
jgi:hypothetical protein